MPRRSSASVVVVGSINADQVVRVGHLPGPGETVGDATIELRPGGKGANQAVAAARCGANVAMVGRVGDDPYGRAQLAALSDDAIDVSHVAPTEGVPTGLAIVTVSADGENSIVVAPGANGRLSSRDVQAAAPLVAGATVLVAQLEIPVATVQRAVELAGRGTVVVVNCAPYVELPASVLAATTVLVANEVEAAALCGLRAESLDDAFDAAARILEKGPDFAVVTMGPLGAVVVGEGEHAHLPAKTVRVVDTTGAGDAFVGAMAAALSAGRGVADATRYGVEIGSAATTQHGARAVIHRRVAQDRSSF